MQKSSLRTIFWGSNILALLSWISVNIYLPSLPTLEKYFHTNPTDLKWSITLFLLGFSLSQFFWGSLSERYGRVKSVLGGLFVAEIGTLMALFSMNIAFFNTARFVEGAGIGAASVLARALLSDSFDKLELVKAFSYISTTANIMPALAPIIGGYLLLFLGWRSIFVFLFLYTTTLVIFFMKAIKETHPAINPNYEVKQAVTHYWAVFTHRQYIGYLLTYVVLSGGMMAFYAATPFIFILKLHLSAHVYGYLSILTVLSYIVGATFSPKLSARFGFNKALVTGMSLGLLAGLVLIACSIVFSLSIWTVTLPMMLYTLAAGIVSPNANACSMSVMGKSAGGPANAVIGAALYAGSAVLTAILTSLDLGHLISLASFITCLCLVGLIGFWLLILRLPQTKGT